MAVLRKVSLWERLDENIEVALVAANHRRGCRGRCHRPLWLQNSLHWWFAKKDSIPFSPKSVGPNCLLREQIAGSVNSNRSSCAFAEPIGFVSTLEVTGKHTPTRFVVSVMNERLQRQHVAIAILDPPSIRSKLLEVPDVRLNKVFIAAGTRLHVAYETVGQSAL